MPASSTQQITREESPLVSIVVITYNSSKYVLETLESAKVQTYQNIELIVSDDCSTDNTLEICCKWIEENKTRFVRAEIIETNKNTGVSGNCNRGLMASKGEWVKLIAGDDLLVCDGLEEFVNYVLSNSEVKVVVSDLIFFGKNESFFEVDRSINSYTLKQQLKSLLLLDKGVPSLGPSCFYNREVLVKIGGYDTRYPLIEDYPLSLKILVSGIKIYALNKKCVRYRNHNESISTSPSFSGNFIEMYTRCAIPVILRHKMYLIWYHFFVNRILTENKYHLFDFALPRYIVKASSVYHWIGYIKKYAI